MSNNLATLTVHEQNPEVLARCNARAHRVRVTRTIPARHNGLGPEERWLTRRGWREAEDIPEDEKVTQSYMQDRSGYHQEKELVLFSGSETAFEIWRAVHELRPTDLIVRGTRYASTPVHAMTVVGVTDEGAFIVKNSWTPVEDIGAPPPKKAKRRVISTSHEGQAKKPRRQPKKETH